MTEKAQLIIKYERGVEPMIYECSSCGQSFILPEDRTPKEAVAEVWAAFKRHIQEDHAE